MALPAWASRTGFRLLDPVKSLRSQLQFILQLHDREALLPREGQRRFLEADGWVAWPGPAMADFLRQFIAHNRMLEGGFVIEDRLLTLADIACPILSVVGSVDEIAPAAGRARDPPGGSAGRHLRAVAPGRALRPRRRLDVEHGDVADRRRRGSRWRAGDGELPREHRADPRRGLARSSIPAVRNRVGYGLELAGGVGAGHRPLRVGTARADARAACAS